MTTPADSSSAHNSSQPNFTLQNITRDLFQAYYQHQHSRSLSDSDIVSLVHRVHDKAILTYPYPCVRRYQFCYPRVMTHPRYAQLVQHNALASEVRLLDVGSCMGTDLRQMILHGVRPQNALGLELEQAFIDLGLDVLYQDRAALQGSFITQNVLADEYLTANQQLASFHAHGIDLIYVGSVYHLLDEAASRLLTERLHALLKPGGALFGRTVGSADPVEPLIANWGGAPRYLHSEASFQRLLGQCGFEAVDFAQTERDAGAGNALKPTVFEHEKAIDEEGTAMYAFYAKKAYS